MDSIYVRPETGSAVRGKKALVEWLGGAITSVAVTALDGVVAAKWAAWLPNTPLPAPLAGQDAGLTNQSVFNVFADEEAAPSSADAAIRLKIDITSGGIVYTKTVIFANPLALLKGLVDLPSRTQALADYNADAEYIEDTLKNKNITGDLRLLWYEGGVVNYVDVGSTQPFEMDFIDDPVDGAQAKSGKSIQTVLEIPMQFLSRRFAQLARNLALYSQSPKIVRENLPANSNLCVHGLAEMQINTCDFTFVVQNVVLLDGFKFSLTSGEGFAETRNLVRLSIDATITNLVRGFHWKVAQG